MTREEAHAEALRILRRMGRKRAEQVIWQGACGPNTISYNMTSKVITVGDTFARSGHSFEVHRLLDQIDTEQVQPGMFA